MISPLVFILCVITLSAFGLIHTLLSMRAENKENTD